MDVDNSKSPGNSGKMKNLLATTFLSTVFISLLPLIFLIFPVFLVFGAIRAYKELKKFQRKKSASSGRMEKILEKEEDSGIDASDDDDEEKKNKAAEKKKLKSSEDQKKEEESEKLEESGDSEKVEDPIQSQDSEESKNETVEEKLKDSEASEEQVEDQEKEEESRKLKESGDSEKVEDSIQNQDNDEESKNLEKVEDQEKKEFNFTFERILSNVNFLKFSLESIDTNLGSSLADYLISTGKSPVLVTFRDVANLEKHESTPENTARLQHKKRKIKVMTLTNTGTTVQQLTEILTEIFEKLEKSMTWIYIFDEHQTALEISEDRKLVDEIRKMATELTDLEKVMETKNEEVIDFSTQVLIPKEDGVLWFNSKL